MADGTAYAASGGWAGGTPLNTGGVLSNYYQKTKTVDPSSGQLTVAKPMQPTTQPSSLARVATTTPATPAQPTTQAAQSAGMPTIAAVPVMTAAPVATAVPTMSRAVLPAASTTQAPSDFAGSGTSSIDQRAISYLRGTTAQDFRPTQQQAAQAAAGPTPVYGGPLARTEQIGNYKVRVVWDNVKGQYVFAPMGNTVNIYDTTHYENNSSWLADYVYQGIGGKNTPRTVYDEYWKLKDDASAKSAIEQAVAQANNADDTKNAVASYSTAKQAYDDKVKAYIAQDEADKATAFDLAGGLQAPNTTAVDTAGRNDLARVISQYASGPSGADAAAYNFIGQGAQATQQAVNSANHATAYANAFNSNYSTFANALTAQQTADANASGQKLAYDIQGISQAVQMLQQQSAQLAGSKQTEFNSALIPMQKQLADYENAVKQYGVSSSQAVSIAKTLLGAGGNLTALLTKLVG